MNKDASLAIRIMPVHLAARMPTYQSVGASGADLYAAEATTIAPGGHAMISTGITLQIPFGFEAQIRSRSGLAAKKQVVVLNSPGTIDSDYRGEIAVILQNFGTEPFIVAVGDRIAQIVFAPIMHVDFQIADLDDTERGAGGFGSTGVGSPGFQPLPIVMTRINTPLVALEADDDDGLADGEVVASSADDLDPDPTSVFYPDAAR